MAFTERIAIIIDAVKDGAVRGLGQTGDAAGGMAAKTRSANLALGLLNNTGIANTGVGKRMVAGMNETGTVMGGLRNSGISLGSALKVGVAGGAAVAGAALLTFAIKGAEKFVELTDAVRKFSLVSGATAEDSSRFIAAAGEWGISADKAATAISKLSVGLGSGKLDLSKWGVEAARTKDGNIDLAETALRIGDEYKKIKDPTERAAFAQAAYGKGWKDMAPLLSKSRAEIRGVWEEAEKRGLIFKQEDLDDAQQFKLAMDDLGEAGEGLAVTLGKDLVPMFTEVVEALVYTADAAQPVLDAFGKIPDAIGRVAIGVQTLFTPWDQNELKMHDQAKAAEKAALENKAFAEAMLEQVNAANNAKHGMEGLTAETMAYTGVALSAEAANRAVVDAVDKVTAATKEATDAGGKNTEANKKQDDAFFRLKQTINQAAEANRAQAIAAAAGTSETHKQQVGMAAYRDTLDFYSRSSSPQAVLATAQLKNTVNSLGGEIDATRYKASIPIKLFLDTAEAEGKLNSLNAKWDELAGAFGPVGPQGPRR